MKSNLPIYPLHPGDSEKPVTIIGLSLADLKAIYNVLADVGASHQTIDIAARLRAEIDREIRRGKASNPDEF